MFKSLEQYSSGHQELPDSQLVWYLYGVGLESLGRDRQPEQASVGAPGPDQLLTRVDAAGLCFSDIKIIQLGGGHPRLHGRDLATDPIIPAHEAALTVVAVGENLQDKYAVGDRFVVQADIDFKGVNMAFGYMLPGALEQYVMVGEEMLAGDDGCYLVSVASQTGHAEAALAEPWACVVRAYRDVRRSGLKHGGCVWVVGSEGAEKLRYALPGAEYLPVPRRIVLTDVPPAIAGQVRDLAGGGGVDVVTTAALQEVDAASLVKKYTDGRGFDDIFVLGGGPEAIEAADPGLARGGILTIVADGPPSRPVNLDVGRVHYDSTYYTGAPPSNPLAGYRKARGLAPLAGGKTWIVGGAGPMGQMHLQMALEASSRPAVLLVSDIDDARLETAQERFGPLAEENGVQMLTINPTKMSPQQFDARLREIAPEGFDDVLTMAAVPALIEQSAGYLADDGVINLFAGVARGTTAAIDAGDIMQRGIRLVGSSGSGIEDLKQTIHLTETGQLSPARAVAGIGGLEAAWDGMEAVRDGTFAGKIIIYPQISGLPLTRLEDLAQVLPEVADKLGPALLWTAEAEQALLAHFLLEK